MPIARPTAILAAGAGLLVAGLLVASPGHAAGSPSYVDNTVAPFASTRGSGPQLTGALAVTRGSLVRWGEDLESTALSVSGATVTAGGSTVVPRTATSVPVLIAAGPYVAVGTTDDSQLDAYSGGASVFHLVADNLSASGLWGSVLFYSESGTTGGEGDEQHLDDLSTGTDETLDTAQGRWVGGGGTLWQSGEVSSVNGSFTFRRRDEAPGATATTVEVPSSACGLSGTLIRRAFGHWIDILCDSGHEIVDTLTGSATSYSPAGFSELGDGILLSEDPSTRCVQVQDLVAGTGPACLGTARSGGPEPVLDDTGGTVAWVDANQATHVVRVLQDTPSVGTPTDPSSVASDTPWTVTVPVDQGSAWTLHLVPTYPVRFDGGDITVTGNSPAGTLSATWDGTYPSIPPSGGPVTWTLTGRSAAGREFQLTGSFTLGSHSVMTSPVPEPSSAAPEPTPPASAAPAAPTTPPAPRPKLPSLKLSVSRLTPARTLTVSSAAAGKAGCVKIVVERRSGARWVRTATSSCLSKTRPTRLTERFRKSGTYRVRVLWSLQTAAVKTWTVRVS